MEDEEQPLTLETVLASRPSEDMLDALVEDLGGGEMSNVAADMIYRAWAHIEKLEHTVSALIESDTRSRALLLPVAAAHGFETRGWYVYALYDEGAESDSAPFYIGMSRNVLGRLASHHRDGIKGKRIARVALTKCPSREDAANLEQAMVGHWQPELNIYLKAV